MVGKRAEDAKSARRRPVAKTPEGREMQLQSLAYDLAEKRLIDGTASSAEIVYLLKSATLREKAELARIEHENLLAQAKVEQLRSSQGVEELTQAAIKAFTQYAGRSEEDDDL